MSSTNVSVAETRGLRRTALRGMAVGLCLLTLESVRCCAAAATPGKVYFFATRDACVSSGAFSARDCAAAFANAREQLRDRAPRFARGGDCRVQFHMCDAIQPDEPNEDVMAYAPTEATAFVPTALGVEMVETAGGVEAAPTLAVDAPGRIFPYFPVSRSYAARRDEQQTHGEENAMILSPNHFEPFTKRKPFATASTFTAAALGAVEGASRDDAGSESLEARRARLKNAPFVE